jgi:L-2-hydroxyglutarate oxidase LhgO
MDKIDCCVIGAGVVGLAIAKEISKTAEDCFIFEAESQFGSQTSSRNSEVIHAGIYYPQHSLKAVLCVQGNRMLYSYCQEKSIAHKKVGKLIVAQKKSQLDSLKNLHQKAKLNGVHDLELLNQKQLHNKEPNISGIAALYSPSTGIIDSHSLMTHLLHDAQCNNSQIVYRTTIENIEQVSNGFIIKGISQNTPFELFSRQVVNCAGLNAQKLAQNTTLYSQQKIPTLHLCKGSYFSSSQKISFQHLIYPLPEANNQGLGIHATLNLSGQVRFGPDVEYLETIDYLVDSDKKTRFANSIQCYYPALNSEELFADYSGIRPKLSAANENAKDFIIQGPADHGAKGLVQLFGIESPGLTSCLAIGNYVKHQLKL